MKIQKKKAKKDIIYIYNSDKSQQEINQEKVNS